MLVNDSLSQEVSREFKICGRIEGSNRSKTFILTTEAGIPVTQGPNNEPIKISVKPTEGIQGKIKSFFSYLIGQSTYLRVQIQGSKNTSVIRVHKADLNQLLPQTFKKLEGSDKTARVFVHYAEQLSKSQKIPSYDIAIPQQLQPSPPQQTDSRLQQADISIAQSLQPEAEKVIDVLVNPPVQQTVETPSVSPIISQTTSVEEALQRIDQKFLSFFQSVQGLEILPSDGHTQNWANIPVTLTDEEIKALPDAQKELNLVCTQIIHRVVEHDNMSISDPTQSDEVCMYFEAQWHGWSSYQRAVFQSPELRDYVCKAKNPAIAIKALLLQLQNDVKTEPRGLSIPRLLFDGLSMSSVPFLMSVTPCWDILPSIPKMSWENLKCLKSTTIKDETPRKLDIEDVRSMEQFLDVLSTSVTTIVLKETHEEIAHINQSIASASIASMIKVVETAMRLIQNPDDVFFGMYAGGDLKQMGEQCFEVMTNWEALARNHNGDVALVLGYGLVSHALDPRHILGAFFTNSRDYLLQGLLETGPMDLGSLTMGKARPELRSGVEAFKAFCEQAKKGSFGPEATQLIRIRFQQVMYIIHKLGTRGQYSQEQFLKDLKGHG